MGQTGGLTDGLDQSTNGDVDLGPKADQSCLVQGLLKNTEKHCENTEKH